MRAPRPASFRRRVFHRRMARLALFAILLLALLPTLGRLAQARAAGSDATPSWAAMCTSRGLQPVLLPAAGQAATHVDGRAPDAPDRSTGDCAYCPLLAATMPAAAASLPVPPAALPPALCTFHALPTRAQPHPCGLGSRGPPTIS